MSNRLAVVSEYAPAGDQPRAIAELSAGLSRGTRFQTLLGATGTGKTMTIAHTIENSNRPTLVMCHNKTLAAQLYGELKRLLPSNAVEYFVSYYDYYQPEAYVASSDTYIAKDAAINQDIDRLRLRATTSLMERRDVVIVATVSAIYGLGSPENYRARLVRVARGQRVARDSVIADLVSIAYTRNDVALKRGTFRVRGDTVDVLPAYEEQGTRISWWGDEIESLQTFDVTTGRTIATLDTAAVYPARHFVADRTTVERACRDIEEECESWVADLKSRGRLLEAQRISERTRFDVEMMRETGTCSGIENYSRHMAGRSMGDRPSCLLDYFPEDMLLVLDESHVTLPQIGGMYNGDKARKQSLIEYGFRLPSALDNRPLKMEEFMGLIPQAIMVSATPGNIELQLSDGVIVEQIIRPTGLLDPQLSVRPVGNQVDDLLHEIHETVARGERVLVTTLTKRMAEDLSKYFRDVGVRSRYMHADLNAVERMDLVRGLRLGRFDVLVGINLLREGLDMPEVSLVAILDADQEGFLRSERSLIQTIGRAARHSNGRAILYADRITDSMQRAISETERRRVIQEAHNLRHGITPTTVWKSEADIMEITRVADAAKPVEEPGDHVQAPVAKDPAMLTRLEEAMKEASGNRDFEEAARLRDELITFQRLPGSAKPQPQRSPARHKRRHAKQAA